ncbi:MAG TPA: serine/threonine-protein kinase, partial [Gemmatimonadales bacterium]|nr:serine/threonine-protein kinase [Gemmatimonadales bacterium]
MDLRTQLQQQLGSAYQLQRELGGGGMSRVFLATEVRLNREVVIKLLSPDLAQSINAERFEREIRLAASLQQANIVPLLAAGDVDGLPWFTMPYVEGESLRARLARGPVSVTDSVAILRDVSRALAYAHARGVVHRDIKPDNVLLSGGTAVVTDFGIAKAISAARRDSDDSAGATLTQLGTAIGTPAYMAPEQVAGDPDVDHRADLYSLGCMAFELLTGTQPFGGRTTQKIMMAHLSEAVPDVGSIRPDCPPALADLVERLLQKDPADRPQSAADVLASLEAAITPTAIGPALAPPGVWWRALLVYPIAAVVVAVVVRLAVSLIGLPDWVFPGALIIMGLGIPALLLTAYIQHVARHATTTTPTLTPGGSVQSRAPTGTVTSLALKASPHITWRRVLRGSAYAVGAFGVAVALFMGLRAAGIGPWGSLFAAGKLSLDDQIVVADLAVAPADSALAPIVGEAVRAAISQSRSVRVMPPADVAGVLQQMKRPHDVPLDPATAREVALRAGAPAVLGGRLARVGTGYAISLDLTSAEDAATLASVQGTANGPGDLLEVVDDLTRKLRGRIGESLRQVQQTVPLARATTASMPALRKYSEAVQANDVDRDYDRAVRAAREAVALDSTFALAWRKLAIALTNQHGSAIQIDSALAKAAQYADRLP